MGISDSKTKELAEPFTHKHKIKGLEDIRGPISSNKFIILDNDFKSSEIHPIKFRYNTDNTDDWQWEWTPHPNESIWYHIKDKYYQIPCFELKQFPYNSIANTDKLIPVQSISKNDEIKSEFKEINSDNLFDDQTSEISHSNTYDSSVYSNVCWDEIHCESKMKIWK